MALFHKSCGECDLCQRQIAFLSEEFLSVADMGVQKPLVGRQVGR
jgi:hypothetical protein